MNYCFTPYRYNMMAATVKFSTCHLLLLTCLLPVATMAASIGTRSGRLQLVVVMCKLGYYFIYIVTHMKEIVNSYIYMITALCKYVATTKDLA